MQIFFILLKHELKINLRQFSKILASFLFFLIFLTSFYLLTSDQQNQGASDIVIILFSLISCLIFSTAEFLKKDFDSGAAEQILLSCDNYEVFVGAKILANWLTCAAPIVLILSAIKPEFVCDAILISFLINLICCFCGSLSILGNNAPMIAVVALPLIIPSLLICITESNSSSNLLALLNIFLGPILVFATTKIVKIAHE